MLGRHHVIERFLGLYPSPAYLEIGVNKGETFHALRAPRKVAVDPQFLFDVNAYLVPGVADFYQCTSDQYFGTIADPGKPFDVIFIDGLHTFEQSLRDLLNALAHLAPGGVIVLDDTIPASFDASISDMHEAFALRDSAARSGANWPHDGSWMGDVFKLVFFIESFCQTLSYASVQESHGQTVVWRRTREATSVGLRSVEQVARLDYRDTIQHREVFKIRPFEQIIGEFKS